ncbi:phosphatidylinositol kinase, partial [Thraustotheca clavata]
VTRIVQVIVANGRATALQKIFVRFADVLIGWTTRLETAQHHRDLFGAVLFEMKELWATNTVFASQLIVSFAREIEEMSSGALSAVDLDRFNAIVVCFMSVAHGLTTLAHASLAKVVHSLITIGNQHLLTIKTVLSCTTVLSNTTSEQWALSAVDCLLLHTCALSERHLASTSQVAVVLDAVDSILEPLSTGRHAIGALRVLSRRIRTEMPTASGGTWTANHKGSTALPHLVQLPSLLPRVTRLALSLGRVGGLSILEVISVDAVGSSKDLQYAMFCIMVLGIIDLPDTESDTTIRGICDRLSRALEKWSAVPPLYSSTLKVILRLLLTTKDGELTEASQLFKTLLNHVEDYPIPTTFELMRHLLNHTSLSKPLDAELLPSIISLSRYEDASMRLAALECLPYFESPLILDVGLERIFDNQVISTKAFELVGHSILLHRALAKPKVKPEAFRSVQIQPLDQHYSITNFQELMRSLELNTVTDAASEEITPLLHTRQNVWQAALWCVEVRLRTHYGNAGQTFGAIEKLLMAYQSNTCAGARLVLEFVHALELNILKACHDDSGSDPGNKTISFYKTNRKVCEDWLLRIRPALICISNLTGATGLLSYYALSLLRGARKPATTASALYSLSLSLCDVLDVSTLKGYVKWGQKKLNLPWIQAILQESQMLYEAAATAYENMFSPIISLSKEYDVGLHLKYESEDAKHNVVRKVMVYASESGLDGISLASLFIRCAQCHACVQAWQKVCQLMHCALELATFLANVQNCTNEVIEIASQMSSLANSWKSELELVQVKTGDSGRDFDDIKTLPPLQEWTILSVVDDAQIRCSLQQLPVDENLLQDHVKILTSKLQVAVLDEVSLACIKGQHMSRRLEKMLVDVRSLEILQGKFSNTSFVPRLRACEHDSSVYYPLVEASQSMGLNSFEIQVQVARLARKQGNYEFAGRILSQMANLLDKATVVNYERARLLYTMGNNTTAFSSLYKSSSYDDTPVQVKVCRKIAQWLQDDVAWSEDAKNECLRGSDRWQIVEDSLKQATTLQPNSYQAWLSWGNYWYQRSTNLMTNSANYIELLPFEQDELKSLFQTYQSLVPYEQKLTDALRRYVTDDEDAISLEALCDGLPESKELLILSQRIRSRAFEPHRAAIHGYLTYLSTASSTSIKSHGLIVTLRLLGVLVKFGHESSLQSVLDAGIASSPIQSWERIVPQLLSRLAHPDPNVSSRVKSILVRLAEQSSELMVYPAVVESLQTSLSMLSTDLVTQVTRVVKELRRIAFLWEDAWVALLSKLNTDVNRRGHTLEKESLRVEKNASLSPYDKLQLAQQKFVAIFKPVLLALDTLSTETWRKQAETPHEVWFQAQFGSLLDRALDRFHIVCDSWDSAMALRNKVRRDSSLVDPLVAHVWAPFHDILKRLQQHQRRQTLPLNEISPVLANLSGEASVPLPGARKASIYISSIAQDVLILSTKTRPKCLTFVASDGRSHRYLLKSREDLHLDERIMQLLATINVSLSANKATRYQDLSTRHYSVIPLSNDAGLIQMVPNVKPLFHLYTNANPILAKASPTAPFYAQLKALGIKEPSPSGRPQWRLAVLRQAHMNLVAEHANKPNILRQELLASSDSINEFSRKTTRFSRSLAVMCVVGYIIGLGDRHLDNILLCESGDVVHIDYNVCFDKGKKLKVPETVPFRLTSLLLGSLGAAGIDGAFGDAMDRTMAVVRSDSATKETILTLLEAFVYDPLVDWKEEAAPKKLWRMEMNVQLSLFSSRAQERRAEAKSVWNQIQDTWSMLQFHLEKVVNGGKLLAQAYSKASAASMQLSSHGEKLRNNYDELQQLLNEHDSIEDFDINRQVYDSQLQQLMTECYNRCNTLQQWTGAPDLNIQWTYYADDNLTLSNLYHSVDFSASLDDICAAVDRTAFYLSQQLLEIRQELQAALMWYNNARVFLYAPERGPNIYQEWHALLSKPSVLEPTQLVDMLKTASDHRLENIKALDDYVKYYDTIEESSVECLPVDTSNVIAQVQSTSDMIQHLKAEYKLTNAQVQKVLKLSVATWWVEQSKFPLESWNDMTLLANASAWLIDVANRGSFRHIQMDNWLENSFANPTETKLTEVIEALKVVQRLQVHVLPQLCHPMHPLRRSTQYQQSLQSFDSTMLHSDKEPQMYQYDKLPLEAYFTTAMTDLWELPAMAELKYSCYHLADCESKWSSSDDNEIKSKWANFLVDSALKACSGEAESNILEALNNASSNLLSLVYKTWMNTITQIFAMDWKFKTNEAGGMLNETWISDEWAQLINVPSTASIPLNSLMETMFETLSAVLISQCSRAKKDQLAQIKHLAFHQQLLSKWLFGSRSLMPIPSSTFSRADMLSLLSDVAPVLGDMKEKRNYLQYALGEAVQKLQHLPNIQDQLRLSVNAIVELVQQSQLIAECVAWIQAAEYAFRDSGSDVCIQMDDAGIHLLSMNKAAMAAHIAKAEAEQQRQVRIKALQIEQRDLQQNMNLLETIAAQSNAELDMLIPRSLPQLGQFLEPLKNSAIPNALRALYEANNHILWENQRLVKHLSKSLKHGILPDFQTKLRKLDDITSRLHSIVSTVQGPLNTLANVSLDGIKKTLAFVVSGGLPVDNQRQVVAALASVIDVLNWDSYDSNVISQVNAGVNEAMNAFFSIADEALELSKEEVWSDTEEEMNDDDSDDEDDEDEVVVRVQERNRYGLQVLKRVKEKLDGDVAQLNPSDHVRWLIDQATNVDNLCVMYEGWTPWI